MSWLAQSWPLAFIATAMIVAAVIDGWKLKVPNWLTFPLVLGGWLLGLLHDVGLLAGTGQPLQVSAASGAAIEPNTITRQADLALYRAKADGRNCVRLFDPTMADESRARLELSLALDDALAKGEFADPAA